MKKIFFLLLTFLTGMLTANAENGVSTENATIPQGGTGIISIELNNDDYTFTAFSFKLTLPEGISFVLDGNGRPTFGVGTRFSDHSPSSYGDGQGGTFACLSPSSAPISGTSGVLLDINVTADAELSVGSTFIATLSELTFTTPSEQEVDFDDMIVTITIGEPDDGRIKFDENATRLPTYTAGGKGYVKMTRAIKAGEWSTIVLPFTLTKAKAETAFGSDVQLAVFTGFETEYADEDDVTPDAIAIKCETYTMTAKKGMTGGTPYLIKTTKDIESFEADDATLVDAVTDVTGKDEYETSGKFTGTFVKDKIPNDGLFLSGNKFWYSTGKTNVKAFRAWFELGAVLDKETDFGSKIRLVMNDEATGIVDVESEKRIADGVYTLQGVSLGQKDVQSLPKGIYIVDGKKVSVK